ncbi:hypothetical protein [Candidatus Nitrospira bockiana]
MGLLRLLAACGLILSSCLLLQRSSTHTPRVSQHQDPMGQRTRMTLFSRSGKSLLYVAPCPWHLQTEHPDSSMDSLSWDLESGMAHCLWCGWGGRLAQPLRGPLHPDLLPSLFRLVLK